VEAILEAEASPGAGEPLPPDDPAASARAAGLRYVTDRMPGIRRKRAGRGFTYLRPDGARLGDRETLARIRSLAIPPAWTDVWICSTPNGHLQATGRDARRRKQYRYHPKWREVRDEDKYERLVEFGDALSLIRRTTDEHLSLPGLPREKVLGTVVRLLEATLIRVGNEEYAKENNSFGLTTLRDRHVDVSGSAIRFRFRGKGGKEHEVGIRDRRLADIVRQCLDIPGYELFQYVDEDGRRQTVDSEDVNDYLRQITGRPFTAKDFRTWAGTVAAAMALSEYESFDSEAQAKRNVVDAIENVAQKLGNTPTVCRACYVHPAILDMYMEGTLIGALRRRADREMETSLDHLPGEEAAVLALLRRRLEEEQPAGR
jgi:DNA topoisomerase I